MVRVGFPQVPLVAQHPFGTEFEHRPLNRGLQFSLNKNNLSQGRFSVPLAEFESATFCSASKRSIQLRYRGMEIQYTGSGLNIPQGGQIVKEEA